MDALFIPTENDFRKWIRDAVKECLENTLPKNPIVAEEEDPLVSRKEIAHYLGIYGINGSVQILIKWSPLRPHQASHHRHSQRYSVPPCPGPDLTRTRRGQFIYSRLKEAL